MSVISMDGRAAHLRAGVSSHLTRMGQTMCELFGLKDRKDRVENNWHKSKATYHAK